MKYILTFINIPNFENFTLIEFLSLCELFNIKNLKYNKDTFSYNFIDEPYISINFDDIESDISQKIIDRAILLKNIIKVYGEGDDIEDLMKNLDENEFKKELDDTTTFKYEFDTRRNKKSKYDYKLILNKFEKYTFNGKVDLKNAQRVFTIFFPLKDSEKVFFGREIAGKKYNESKYYTKYDLIHRKYLGPTSTDHTLSFLMANFAQIKENNFIIDPFVGTGSLLIPPTIFGGICFGCDLDARVLRGYGVGYTREGEEKKVTKNEGNIFSNFDDYNLIRPQILRQDINHPNFKKNNFLFDAIICDPPYGWRAGSKITGLTQEKKNKRLERINLRIKENIKNNEKEDINYDYIKLGEKKTLFLPTSHCEIDTIFDSLVEFAKYMLKKDGLLVCLFPVQKTRQMELEHDHPINFPQNNSFKLIHCCENKNSSIRSRWCLVYRKII